MVDGVLNDAAPSTVYCIPYTMAAMIKIGLCSITFRGLGPIDVIDVAKRAELQGIEWGGDVHVPHADVSGARETRRLTVDAGLKVSSYGSYYKVGSDEPFEGVLATARALEAPMIRVWAGERSSADADEDYKKKIADETRRIAEMACADDIAIAYEFHNGSLADSAVSALALLKAVGHEDISCYWQPPPELSSDDRQGSLEQMLPHLSNLHVFQWAKQDGENKRLPLADGKDEWQGYLEMARSTGRDHWALLEFVRDDSPEALFEDAHVLTGLLRSLADGGWIDASPYTVCRLPSTTCAEGDLRTTNNDSCYTSPFVELVQPRG